MTIISLLMICAVISCLWSVVSAILLTRALSIRGNPTPFPWYGLYLFKNLGRYKELTVQETGKVGSFYYSFIIPINLAWIFALLAMILR